LSLAIVVAVHVYLFCVRIW